LKSGPSPWEILRARFGAKYLDLAETLPKFNGGRIHSLQSIRELQRADAQKQFERSRPMEGVSVRFDRLLLIELFPIEDYDDLEQQLRRLFPGDRKIEETIDSIAGNAESLFQAGWFNVGHIVRENAKPSLYPFALTALPELPEEVKRIEVSVSKILPSLFAVSFDIEMTEKATDRLNSLLNQRFLTEVTFKGILPTRRNLGNRSMLGSDQVMRRAVLQSLSSLRLRIERSLGSRIRGLFLRMPKGSSTLLPALEMLSIRDESGDVTAVGETLRRNASWADCFGVTHWLADYLFVKPGMLFQWPNDWRGQEMTCYKLVSFNDGKEEPNESQDLKYLLLRGIVISSTPLIAILGIIESVRRDVEKLRFAVYRTLTDESSFRRLASEIRLNNNVQIKEMILSRLQFELKESKLVVEDAAQNLREFVALGQRQTNPLGDVFLHTIQGQLHIVSGHGKVVSGALSDYLERRNLEFNFRLQKRLLWWTASISILTILLWLVTTYGIVKDWPSFGYAESWVRLHLHW